MPRRTGPCGLLLRSHVSRPSLPQQRGPLHMATGPRWQLNTLRRIGAQSLAFERRHQSRDTSSRSRWRHNVSRARQTEAPTTLSTVSAGEPAGIKKVAATPATEGAVSQLQRRLHPLPK